MVPGRAKQVFKQWLKARPKDWRDGIDVVAMDGFSGFKTASVEELPDAVEAMDPLHVAGLVGDALDEVRRRVQQEITGHRGRAKDPLYRARRTLHTGADLLTTNDALTFFTRPELRTGRLKRFNGRLEHLCGIALEFHNRGNYRNFISSLLRAGGPADVLQFHF